MSKTKKSLLLSCLSMLLCATMLIGSTFAWFTDNASTGVNTIQAGTLDIGLYEMPKSGAFNYAELDSYTNLEQKQLTFRDKNGNENILWEPGATFMTQEFIIVNEGNLAAKMKININGMDATNKKLLDAIDFTFEACVSGDYRDANATWMSLDNSALMYSSEFTLDPHQASSVMRVTAKMKETAGNEYQGLTLDGIGITVKATQAAKEYDSFDNQYDADATYDDTKEIISVPEGVTAVQVTTFEELKAALVNGGAIEVMNDIAVSERLNVSAETIIYGNGNTLTYADDYVGTMIDASAKTTIYNLNLDGENKGSENEFYAVQTSANTTLQGLTIKNFVATKIVKTMHTTPGLALTDVDVKNNTLVDRKTGDQRACVFWLQGTSPVVFNDVIIKGNTVPADYNNAGSGTILYFRNSGTNFEGNNVVIENNTIGNYIAASYSTSKENTYVFNSGSIKNNQGGCIFIVGQLTFGENMHVESDIEFNNAGDGQCTLTNNGYIKGDIKSSDWAVPSRGQAIYTGTGTLDGTNVNLIAQ